MSKKRKKKKTEEEEKKKPRGRPIEYRNFIYTRKNLEISII